MHFIVSLYLVFFCSSFTVLGPRGPAKLGIILPHEQPLFDLTALYTKLRPTYKRLIGDISKLDFQLKNLGKIRQFP